MTHTATTWGLTDDWDLDLDANGNPKMLNGLDAVLQNVANECRLFVRDAYFRYEDGIDWFSDQLGLPLQQAVLSSRIREAAERVPGVTQVDRVEIEEIDQAARKLKGKIYIQTEYGNGISNL